MKKVMLSLAVCFALVLSGGAVAGGSGGDLTDSEPVMIEVVIHKFTDSQGLDWVVYEYRYDDGSVDFSDPTRSYGA
jgi:hypothetical protein